MITGGAMSTDSAGTTAVVRTEPEGTRSPVGRPSHREEQTMSSGR